MTAAIHSVSDWSDDEIESVLLRAGQLADGAPARARVDALVGMCFFQTSLRTRVGFEAAAVRLGVRFVEVVERRSSTESMPERMEDTLRVVSGYCDLLVVRSPLPSVQLRSAVRSDCSWLNAGDSREHPTQALVDLFAVERLVGRFGDVRLAIVGDLRMRSVQSLLRLIDRRPSASLALVSDPELVPDELPANAATMAGVEDLAAFDPDVVYMAGIPHKAVPEEVRGRLRLDRKTLDRLRPSAVVLSPLPVIDEVAFNARSDTRIRWFQQSDLGLFVRAALLELVLDAN